MVKQMVQETLKTRRKGLGAVLLAGFLLTILIVPLAQGVRNNQVTTVDMQSICPQFTAPLALKVPMLTFTLGDSANGQQFTGAIVTYSGDSVTDISGVYLYCETAGNGGTFDASTDVLLASNTTITSTAIAMLVSFTLVQNVNHQFYIAVDIAAGAVDGNRVDVRINTDELTIAAKTWPDSNWNPGGQSTIDAQTPWDWANFAPAGWQMSRNVNCSISVRDNRSGLAVDSARYQFTSDGGQTWSQWTAATCTGTNGTTALQTITASQVPFASDSIVNNSLRFCILDVGGNNASSPMYTVKIDSTPPGNWALVSPAGWYTLNQRPTVNITVQDTGSGLNVTTVSAEYSTNGGQSWSAVPTVACLGASGSTAAEIVSALTVPFDNDSADQNCIRFKVFDITGKSNTSAMFIIMVESNGPPAPNLAPEPQFTRGCSNTVSWNISGASVSGLANYNLECDDGPEFSSPLFSVNTTNTTWEFKNLTDGLKYHFRVRTLDNAGKISPYSTTVNSTQDSSPPVTGVITQPASPNGLNGWFKTAPTVALPSSDGSSGVNRTLYTLDNGTAQLYTGQFLLPEGKHTLSYWAEDNLGNLETVHNKTFEVDTAAPQTTAETTPNGTGRMGGWYNVVPSVRIAAFDNTSGVSRTRYFIDNGATQEYSQEFNISMEGEHLVTFWSEDMAGNIELARNITVNVDTRAPFAAINGPERIFVGENGSFESLASTDVVIHLWNFGDGTAEVSGQMVNHAFQTTGTFTVNLKVTDRAGWTCSTQVHVQVVMRGVNYAPDAVISNTATIYANKSVTFDGSGSTDEDKGTLRYEWDFGDGTNGTGVSVSHTYVTNGIYNLRLRVVDSGGLSDTETRIIRVYVEGMPNQAPLAIIVQKNTAYAGENVIIDGSNSSDENLATANFTWDFGDGTWGFGPLVSHIYQSDSSYMLKLTIRDEGGLDNFMILTVKVFKRGVNEPPVAQFTSRPLAPTAGQLVEFDASFTVDEDPMGLNYSWDFGDGSTVQGKFATHRYASKGTYNVKLRVKDAGGLTGIFSTNIVVKASQTQVGGQSSWIWIAMTFVILGLLAAVLGLAIAINRKKGREFSRQTAQAKPEGATVSLIAPPPTQAPKAPLVVEKGLNYLLEGETSEPAYMSLEKLLKDGTGAVVFTHVHPKKMERMHSLSGAEIIWLSEISENVPSLDPSKMDYEIMEKIITFIKEKKSTGVVFLDGFDVLVQTHSFENVLDFIHNINEVASVNESTVIIYVNRKAMKELEFNQLRAKFDRS